MIHADIRLSVKQGNPFVHVVTDEQLHSNIDNNEYVRILKKIGNISLTNHVDGAICISYGEINGRDFNELVERFRSMNYEYAVFWFEGCMPMEEFEEEFLSWAVDNNDWQVMGHLEFENRVALFGQQFIVINLNNIDEINFRQLYKTNTYPKFKESTSEPKYIKGSKKYFDHDNVKQYLYHFFDHFMYRCLDLEYTIINIPNSIKDTVFSINPDKDVEHTLSWLTNQDFHRKTYDEKSQYKFDHVAGDKWMLYEFLNMSNEILYVTNTEDYPEESIVEQAKDTNVIICPASGLNQFLFAMPHIDTLEKIVWTDFNPMSIRWLTHIIDNWDGYNFRQFFEDSKPLLLAWGLKDLEFLNYRDKQVDELTEMFNTDEINAKYNRLRKIEHVFLNIDIVNQYDQILPHVNDSNVILQLSNIYSYEINYIVNKYFKAQAAFYGLVNGLLESNKNVYLRGDTPQGTYYEMTNIGKLGSL